MTKVLRAFKPVVALVMLAAFPAVGWSNASVPEHHYVLRSEAAGTPTQGGALLFTGKRIVIPVVAVEPGKPDTTFEVHSEVDPTLIVWAGAQLRFMLGNADAGMPHGLDVTAHAPPYPQTLDLSLMKRTPRDVPMHGARTLEQAVAVTGLVKPATGRGMQIAVRSTGWFSLGPGIYYYVCPVPGHARRGMYGKIIAR